jgi:plastocyanin
LRKLLVSLLVTALVGASAAPALAATKKVTVGDNYFVEDGGVPTVKVAKDTRVKWVWRGKSLHNVKVAAGPVKFGSDPKRSGSYAKRLKRAGTYTIVCVIHGADDQSMKLVVK